MTAVLQLAPTWPLIHSLEMDNHIADYGDGFEQRVNFNTAYSRANGEGGVTTYKGRNRFTLKCTVKDFAGEAAYLWAFYQARSGPLDAFYLYNCPDERATADATGIATAGRYLVRFAARLTRERFRLALYNYGLELIEVRDMREAATFTMTTGIWVCPGGVSLVRIECWGAGGSGSTGDGFGNWVGGGGGAFAMKAVVPVVEGLSYTIQVGTSTALTVLNEGDSFFGIAGDTPLVLAKGGVAGGSYNTGPGPLGGQAADSIGDVRYSGGQAGEPLWPLPFVFVNCAGGGGAGSTGAGGDAIHHVPGVGGPGGGGDGGGIGAPGNDFGGGGGSFGALGGLGKVILTY
jgi:hypothetical protein